MQIAETIGAILNEAKIKPIEEHIVVLRFGLRSEAQRKLDEVVALCKEDARVTVRHVTRDWVRGREAKAIERMRGAMIRLHINTDEFREMSKEEPYHSLCEVLIGI